MPNSQSSTPALHPTIFIIFGVTGDLASRKLLPALLALYSKRLLPARFSIVGFSRRSFNREEFREFIRSRLNIRPGQFKEEEVKHFLDHMSYEQGTFDSPDAYRRLAEKLKGIDDRWGQCSNKLFHLSVPPKLYEGVLTQLAASGITVPCADETGWTRILIEKPFGNDIATAHALDKLLGKLFKEEQIFRIDHYLAKESLQNIVAFRFANSIFEPLWRSEWIDKIHIRLFEKNGLEGRGAFYDQIGALKDVGQNHLLQMLALVTMDEPASFTAKDIRAARSHVLSKLRIMTKRTLAKSVVKGQYAGYADEAGVAAGSKTETYFRIESYIDSKRWKGVPIFLESGKALAESKVSITVYFKDPRRATKGRAAVAHQSQNLLTFRIQPDEGIKIKFFVKTPGHGFAIEPKSLRFKYSDIPSFGAANDYERLIQDAFIGDQTLFASTEEIMASWKFVTAIIDGWNDLPLKVYEKGVKEVE